MHFSAGDASRRQQTYLGRAGMKDLRDVEQKEVKNDEGYRLDKACDVWEEPDGEG